MLCAFQAQARRWQSKTPSPRYVRTRGVGEGEEGEEKEEREEGVSVGSHQFTTQVCSAQYEY